MWPAKTILRLSRVSLMRLAIAVLMLVIAACTPGSQNGSLESTLIPKSTPEPTAIPNPPAPQYSPTLEDFKSLAFDRVEAAYGSNIRFFSFSGRYSPYASAYIATACIAGSDTSFDGFREFLNQTLLRVRRTDKVPIINVSGEEAISQIIKAADRIPNLGPSSEMSDCMRRYLYPKSYSDAAPAIELVKSFKDLQKVSPDFRDSVESSMDRSLYKWFGAWVNQDRPFLPWLCEQIKPGDYVSCRIEVEVVKQFQDFSRP